MEVFEKILALTFWEKFADLHGFLAMFSLVLFGAGIVLYYIVKKSNNFIDWFKNILLLLFINLVLLDIVGLTIYVPYRASLGPKTFLKSSEATAWLHSIVFEHKEFLAFAPPMIILTAFLVTRILGKDFNDKKVLALRTSVIFSLIASLVIVLLVASEAVLVAKVAPLR